jgi:hypothetical protein
MVWRTSFEFVVICAAIGALSPCPAVLAQKIVVDATPTHFVNAFSPIRALGAGVDRLRAGEGAPEIDRERINKEEVESNTDSLLSGPILKEIRSRMATRDLQAEHGTADRGMALEPARCLEQSA